MQFINGPSLGSAVARGGRLPWQRAADIGPNVGEVVGLGPVNSDFYSTQLYLWTIP